MMTICERSWGSCQIQNQRYICDIFHNLVFSVKKGDIAVPDVCIYHSQITAGLAVGFWQHSGSNSNSLYLDANHWNVFRIEFRFEFLFIVTSVAIVSLLCPTAQAHQTLLRSWANSFSVDGVFYCCYLAVSHDATPTPSYAKRRCEWRKWSTVQHAAVLVHEWLPHWILSGTLVFISLSCCLGTICCFLFLFLRGKAGAKVFSSTLQV